MANKAALVARAPARERSGFPAGPTRKQRSRGRPRSDDAEDVREKLLTAARELFMRYGYRAVSSRQIGAAAGVNFAMIRYYFGGKPGLYREILNAVIQPARATLENMASDRTPMQVSHFLAKVVRTWAANPWMAGFMVREVLAPDGPMRAMYLREFVDRHAPFAEGILKDAIGHGELRPDVDPRLLLLSVISLAVFPFIGYSVTSRTFGVRNDEEFIERFLRHTTDLLLHGVGPRPAHPKDVPS
jgi:TetR/AcrR family transcriptional regulator